MKKQVVTYLQTHFPIIVTCLMVVIAIFFHPTINSTLLKPYRQVVFNNYFKTLSAHQPIAANDLWYFREFYSRGHFTLSKYDPEFVQTLSDQTFNLPATFQPYLVFQSDKITSVEGSIEPLAVTSVINSPLFDDYEIIAQSMFFKYGINRSNNTALLAQTYTIPDAAHANGFLLFDLRDEAIAQSLSQKHWLVLEKINLD